MANVTGISVGAGQVGVADDVCPVCSNAREDARYCANCRHDFESFMARYEGVALPAAISDSFEQKTSAAPTSRSWLVELGRVVMFLGGLSALVVAITAATRAQLLPNLELSYQLAAILFVVMPFVGGQLSRIVPGRKARGLFKGWLVGFVGWMAVTWIAVQVPWLPDGMIFMTGTLMNVVTCTVGASVFRLILVITD